MSARIVGCFLLGCSAVLGYAVQPPLNGGSIRLLDAVIFFSVGVGIWGLFHMLGCPRLSRGKLLISLVASVVVWGLLVSCLMGAMRKRGMHYKEKLVVLSESHNHPAGGKAEAATGQRVNRSILGLPQPGY